MEPNRKTRRMVAATRGIHLITTEKKTAATERAFEEAVKDNLADKVITNFVDGLTKLPFRARFKFCFCVLFRK